MLREEGEMERLFHLRGEFTYNRDLGQTSTTISDKTHARKWQNVGLIPRNYASYWINQQMSKSPVTVCERAVQAETFSVVLHG